MYHGIINIYKEKGYTSHDVVAVLRRILNQKKIGHTGTLDPEATGVLPVCLGRGTKVAGMLTDKDKAYRTTFLLGEETDTQDHTGTVIKTMPWQVEEDQVVNIINGFVGPIEQVPPMYSAIKVDGRKLYDYAREGIEVKRKVRNVVIHTIEDVQIDLPRISMTVQCSKGTYIRTLCRDIAEALGTCGHMVALERLQSGMFKLQTAVTLDAVREAIEDNRISDFITAVDEFFCDLEALVIKDGFKKMMDNGNKLPSESFVRENEPVDGERFNVYNGLRDYMGVYEWNGHQKLLVPITFFNIPKERG